MSKIELKFVLDEDNMDDEIFKKRIFRMSDMAGALFEIKFNLMKRIINKVESKDDADPIEVMGEMLHEVLDEYNITEDIL